MQMEEMVKQLDAQGDCLTQFARFIEVADASHMSGIGRLLKGFNVNYRDESPENFRFTDFALEVLTEIQACSEEDLDKEGIHKARLIGLCYSHLVRLVFWPGDDREIELFVDFLKRASSTPRTPLLDAMRGAVCEVETKAIREDMAARKAASLANLSESLDAAESAEVSMHPLEWMDKHYQEEKKKGDGRIRFTINLYQDGMSDYGVDFDEDDFKAILAGWKTQEVEEDGLPTNDALQACGAIMSRMNRSAHAKPSEPRETAEVIPETTVLERKFQQFQEKTEEPVKVTLQVWDPVEGVSNDGIELTREEFAEVLATVRKTRAEESAEKEMTPEQQALLDEAVATFKRYSAAFVSSKKRQKEDLAAN
jgi:hypothetical protein